MRRLASRWLPWLVVAVALAWLLAYPCSFWSLAPASAVGAVAATSLARKIWNARAEVFAGPAMILAVFGISGLGAFGLWIVAFRCLGHGGID